MESSSQNPFEGVETTPDEHAHAHSQTPVVDRLPPAAGSQPSPVSPASGLVTAESSLEDSTATVPVDDDIRPPMHLFSPTVPASSPSASSSSSSSSGAPGGKKVSTSPRDEILSPAELAKKLEQHSAGKEDEFAQAAPVFEDFDDELDGADSTIRFRCVVGRYALKGDGLDTHTRYEVTTRWAKSIVDESNQAAAAAKQQKASKEADDDESAAAVRSSGGTSASNPTLTKIPPQSKVGHRYTDFVTLQAILTQLYPSHLIPCLPPKGLLQRFDEEFISMRRRGLQRFLLDLSRDPTLSKEKLVTDFLLSSPRDWEAISAAAIQTHHMGGAKNSWLVQGTMSLGSKLLANIKGDEDTTEKYAHDEHHRASVESGMLHQQLHTLYDHLNTQVDAVVEAEKELAEAWMEWYGGFEVSDESIQSSRVAQTHDVLGLDFAQLLPLTQRIGLMSHKKADGEASAICELMHHTAGMIQQIQELFKRRSAVSHAVYAAAQAVKKYQADLEQSRQKGMDAEAEQRLQGLITQGQAILRDKQSSLDQFHAIASDQIRTYTTQRRREMKQCIVEFVEIQLKHEETMQLHWSRLLQTCEKR
jgi:hypothetical protein